MNLEIIISFLVGLGDQFPVVAPLFAIFFTAGAAIKTLREGIAKFVKETPSTKDDEFLEKVESTKIVKIIYYIGDLFFRIKRD